MTLTKQQIEKRANAYAMGNTGDFESRKNSFILGANYILAQQSSLLDEVIKLKDEIDAKILSNNRILKNGRRSGETFEECDERMRITSTTSKEQAKFVLKLNEIIKKENK